MKWIEISVFFEAENRAFAEDLIANAFAEVGIQGVCMEPTDEVPVADWAREHLPRPVVPDRVTGYLAENDSSEATCRRLEAGVERLGREHSLRARFAYRQLDEEDWAESWKAFFWPEKIGRRVVVKPTWRSYDPQPGDLIIELDPGMAFGTGTHPTTRLCVQFLEEHVRGGESLLDVGAGSGILMAAAHKLGAVPVWGIDIDPVAVEITGENLALNGVPEQDRRVFAGDLARDVDRQFDLVVANILSEVILSLLDQIPGVLAPGGIFICSGIIDENAPGVLAKMRAMGFDILEVKTLDGWTAISGKY
jgi:ribosomal protein L11 methyltransferase